MPTAACPNRSRPCCTPPLSTRCWPSTPGACWPQRRSDNPWRRRRPHPRPTRPSSPSASESARCSTSSPRLPNKKIARVLGVTPHTVKWHLRKIYAKLGVAERDEAVARLRDLELGRDNTAIRGGNN
ncbi:LuxR C-terminal-related transcriptional regulator [Variovorax sp. dw_954]|uniref:helix-turn-helix transcriptional regulator n=1 Tax=Variovorax sp. dw_954 TaxID=2720078 RepID=UPI002116A0F9|nr:LuxR C-terminal-related transcriptional regulator [Variovorax sp. dw_954]